MLASPPQFRELSYAGQQIENLRKDGIWQPGDDPRGKVFLGAKKTIERNLSEGRIRERSRESVHYSRIFRLKLERRERSTLLANHPDETLLQG